jgi:hypothetical protein
MDLIEGSYHMKLSDLLDLKARKDISTRILQEFGVAAKSPNEI